VWAREAGRVELVTGDERRAMAREDGRPGWWVLDEPEPGPGPGTDYAFSLDGSPPRPDPRSRWQPYGVHGPSRTVEPRPDSEAEAARSWRGFHLPSAVLYELHLGTFTPEGTLDAAADRLDHLVELGITAVSLMPVNAFSGRHGWGYDGVGLYAVHDAYGGPGALRRFVDACHGRGLGVVLDVVYNHLGPAGNYLGEFGPYFTDRYGTPWGDAVNFDGPGSDEVRRFFLDNARMWLRDYGFDGLRLDAVHAIVDTSAVHVLEELGAEAEALAAELGRPLWIIAESDLNDPRLLWSPERGGYGLHAQWSDDFHHALHAALTGERDGYYEDFGDLAAITTALRHGYVYAGRHSVHRDRRHGRSPHGLTGHRFLGYIQNHDQVGNRARGERIGELVGVELQKVAAALVLTSPFIPMVFQGEEWAASSPFQYFTNHDDPELGQAVREGRRGEFAAFGWAPDQVPDPQDPDTFRRSKLRWEERSAGPHSEVEDWYRRLIAFRRSRPELLDGRLDRVRAESDEDARTVVVRRGDVAVLCNLGPAPTTVATGPGWEDVELRLASREGAAIQGGTVRLPPESAVVLVRDCGR
jgi:maltooligosyltrehalose trehalohydrolase